MQNNVKYSNSHITVAKERPGRPHIPPRACFLRCYGCPRLFLLHDDCYNRGFVDWTVRVCMGGYARSLLQNIFWNKLEKCRD